MESRPKYLQNRLSPAPHKRPPSNYYIFFISFIDSSQKWLQKVVNY